MSNLKWFKYEWIWEKEQGKQPLLVKIQPNKSHENILVFGKGGLNYNPQHTHGNTYTDLRRCLIKSEHGNHDKVPIIEKNTRYPTTVLKFAAFNEIDKHPTQKPVALYEYLIKTYTNEGDLVLDNCAGSGTTAIACINTHRKYILIEKEEKYIDVINNRIKEHTRQLRLF